MKTKSGRFTTKFSVSFFRLCIVIVLGLVVTLGFAGFGAFNGIIAASPSLENINVVPEGYITRFYYSDGTVSQTLVGAGGNREYVSLDVIPDYVYNAFIAIEDERFWEHDGIDIRSIFRAVSELLRNRELSSGGSTITQQLIKNQVFSGGNESSKPDKVIRKIQEQYLAIKLEDQISKKQILEYYLNTINFGQGAYGIQMAALTYYGKNASELTLSEAAVLASLPQSPTNMNPYRYPADNNERRAEVLREMLEGGFIDRAQYDEAVLDAEDVYVRIHDYVESNKNDKYYSYFTDEVIDQVLKDLEALGYTQTEASNMLYTGGLSVYTTQDRQIQAIADSVINDADNYPSLGEGTYYDITYALSVQKADKTVKHYQLADFLKYFNYFDDTDKAMSRIYGGLFDLMTTDLDFIEKCIDKYYDAMVEEGDTVLGERYIHTLQPQISFVMMDHSTGKVLALVGGRGEKTGNRTFSRATDALRQVGSTYKVLAAYLPAIDTGLVTLGSAIDDSPYFYTGTTKQVSNWYRKGYQGLSSARLGISYSMNVLAVKTIEKVTPQVAFGYLQKLGFTTLVDYMVDSNGKVFTDIGLPLALGGLTNGVTNIELTAAYAAIANNGVYNTPYYYTKIVDHDGKTIVSHKTEKKQVMKSSTAYLLTSAMEDTVMPGIGSASSANPKEYKMTVAGKSGTTTDNYDYWFEGFSPYYTAGIWEGFDISYTIDTGDHLNIWRKIMEQVHELYQLEDVGFTQPDNIVDVKICSKSGLLAVDGICDCYEGGSCVRVEHYAKGTAPTEYCNIHRKVTVCVDTGMLATRYCENTKEEVLLLKNEPEIWTPVETDLTTLSPTPTPEGYVRPKDEEVKKKVEYTTVDTKYIVPKEYCNVCGAAFFTPTPMPTPKPVIMPDDEENSEEGGIYGPAPVPTPTPTPAPWW